MRGFPSLRHTDQQKAQRGVSPKSILPLPCAYETLVSCPRNSRYIVAIKMGRRQGGPSRTGVKGAYLNRYVTDEQRGRRPIFIATLRAGASWLFFRVARSTRMTQIWVLYCQSGSDRLEKQPTDLRQYTCYFGDRTLGQRNSPAAPENSAAF